MKKTLLLLITSFLVISCEIKEEIYIKKDGSGTINLVIDYGSQMASMKGFINNKSEKPLNISKKVDTVIHFKDLLEPMKDSIQQLNKKDRDIINQLKSYSLNMNVDPENNVGMMAITNEFKDINKLQHLEEMMQKASSFNEKKQTPKNPIKYETGFELKRKKFKRFVIQKKLTQEEEEKYQSYTKGSKIFLSGITYTLVYHFDRKIKKVTNKNVMISDDKKSLEISYPLDKLTLNPYLLEFEVTLK